MANEGRDRVTGLYHAALERAAGERAAFLREACAGDEGLRLEIESLLRHDKATAPFLENPAVNAVAPLLATSAAAMIGRDLGPYQITSLLGAGGMGEVYRARDRNLGRDVAIKILPHEFTANAERRGRFAREARVLATLSHPHIAAIYGLEQDGDRLALVLELVEGPTLAERIDRGPLVLSDALKIARQIAEALDAAHLKGIVHRDLKPANIVLEGTAARAPGDAQVKVLDFGIAKIISTDDADARRQTTTPLEGTEDGRILGTPSYMSPEQAHGQGVDKRSDIWAFGCVLFEMLTGRRAFQGDSFTDTLAHVLEREVDWTALPPRTPPSIHALLRRCLQKDPLKRLRDIGDALELDAGELTAAGSVAVRPRRPRLVWLTGLVIGAVLAAGTLALWQRRTAPAMRESLQFEIGSPPGAPFPGLLPGFAIAPDGNHLVVVATSENESALWVRRMGSSEYRQLNGTRRAAGPFWSPDSRQIAFFADGKLKTVGLSGELPFEVCDVPLRSTFSLSGGTWSRDGVILFTSQTGALQKVSDTGGNPTAVIALREAETEHRWPWFLPDGQHFLFLALSSGPHQLRVGSLTSADSAPVGTIRSNAVYAAGHLLFVQGGLMAQPFDLRSRQLKGEPYALNSRMAVLNGRSAISVSETGLLGYSAAFLRAEMQLTWMDRAGHQIGTVGEHGSVFNYSLSPDEGRVAVSSIDAGGDSDIWVIDLARDGDKYRVVSDQGSEWDPDWSPDGKHIAFTSNRKGHTSLFRRPADGSGGDELLAAVMKTAGMVAPDWSPSGKSIVFESGADLWIQSLDNPNNPSVFLQTAFREGTPAFSPDGRWIAYSSDRTGRMEIYMRPFPSKDPEYKISRDGGRVPRWRNDTEIFFLALDGTLMSARFKDPAKGLAAMIPQPLFKTGIVSTIDQHPYDVAKDGQRFLIPVQRETENRGPITIVTNWIAKLPK